MHTWQPFLSLTSFHSVPQSNDSVSKNADKCFHTGGGGGRRVNRGGRREPERFLSPQR